jgi:hypothetical protein
MNGSVDANASVLTCGEATVRGALMNLNNAQILFRASLALNDLKDSASTPIKSWKNPPATGPGMSACAVIAVMPGAEDTSGCR